MQQLKGVVCQRDIIVVQVGAEFASEQGGIACKIDLPEVGQAGDAKIQCAASQIISAYTQRAALRIQDAGIIEHDIDIECGGARVTRLEERPEVVKECRAAVVASLKG